MSGREESFKYVTEKMALPRTHVAGMLPEAFDTEKISQGPHIHPSLTASRARIQASEEPLGPSGWASGTLWGRGRRMEGKGVGRQSKRAGNTTKPLSDVPGQRTWLDST